MKLGTSRRGTLLPALVAFLVLAGVGVSLAGSGRPAPEPDAEVTASDAPRTGHPDDRGPSGVTGPHATEEDADGVVGDEDAACAAALEEGEAALERAHGLDRAIEAILTNCARGHTRGLLNALARLQENQERQAEREAGTGPNEHANENANGPGGKADQDGAQAENGRPEEPGGSAEHANEHASSQGPSSR